jgi:hypothetical protein
MKLLEQGIKLYLTGDTGSTSQDFTRLPVYVDRAPRWVFLWFLARVASFVPREAPGALGLNSTAVSRPERTPLTSQPAYACGMIDSGHHRRRAVPRRDRQDLPELTLPFVGPPSSIVSRAALFTSAVTISKRGGILGRKKKKPRGFLNSQRLMWIVPQGHKVKNWFRKSPGASV